MIPHSPEFQPSDIQVVTLKHPSGLVEEPMIPHSPAFPPPDIQVVTLKHPSGFVEEATRRRLYEWSWKPDDAPSWELDEARFATLEDCERGYFGWAGAAERRQKFAEMPAEAVQGLKWLMYLRNIGLYCWLTDARIVRYEVDGIFEPGVVNPRGELAILRQLFPKHVAITPDDIEIRNIRPFEPDQPGVLY